MVNERLLKIGEKFLAFKNQATADFYTAREFRSAWPACRQRFAATRPLRQFTEKVKAKENFPQLSSFCGM